MNGASWSTGRRASHLLVAKVSRGSLWLDSYSSTSVRPVHSARWSTLTTSAMQLRRGVATLPLSFPPRPSLHSRVCRRVVAARGNPTWYTLRFIFTAWTCHPIN
jgi:hypothetical protein